MAEPFLGKAAARLAISALVVLVYPFPATWLYFNVYTPGSPYLTQRIYHATVRPIIEVMPENGSYRKLLDQYRFWLCERHSEHCSIQKASGSRP